MFYVYLIYSYKINLKVCQARQNFELLESICICENYEKLYITLMLCEKGNFPPFNT